MDGGSHRQPARAPGAFGGATYASSDVLQPAADTAFTVYDGTNVRCQSGAGGVTVTVNAPARPVRLQVFGKPPNGAQQDGAALSRAATRAAFDAAGDGWWQDTADGFTVVKFQHTGGTSQVSF